MAGSMHHQFLFLIESWIDLFLSSEVMDMSFANQFLALCRLASEGGGYDNRVYDISPEQDTELAALKLKTAGISIDELTPEQISYLSEFRAGT